MRPFIRQGTWLGPLLTFVGFISYFMVLARFPDLRDVPWLNSILVILGLVLTFLGIRENWGTAGTFKRLTYGSGIGFALLFAVLFFGYVHVLSYQLPETQAETEGMETAPGFTLSDAQGQSVGLTDYQGKKVVLVFYRGFW
mgnify:CR=1 FL=1